MADLQKIAEDLSSLSVIEAAELSKILEEKWGVSAAAAAPVAVSGAGGGDAAPAAEAKKVLITTEPINSQLPTAPRVDPGLKPNHPNHNINPPIAANGRLCPGIVFASPLLLYLPNLGPKTIAAANAAKPPIACTAAEPAKSLNPLKANQPLGFQTQLATTG